jgi:hypothetical protein
MIGAGERGHNGEPRSGGSSSRGGRREEIWPAARHSPAASALRSVKRVI